MDQIDPLLSFRGFRLPHRRMVLRALDLYVIYAIDLEDALIAGRVERQTIHELYSYDWNSDQVPDV